MVKRLQCSQIFVIKSISQKCFQHPISHMNPNTPILGQIFGKIADVQAHNATRCELVDHL